MSCPLRKIQPGTVSYRPTNPESVQTLQARLNEMQKERTKQDKMWDEEPPLKPSTESATEPIQLYTNKKDRTNR
jgi:hypothetical protein